MNSELDGYVYKSFQVDTMKYGTPKLSYVVIFLVVLSKNCVNLSMHYVIILKTRVVLSIYNVDMPIHVLLC